MPRPKTKDQLLEAADKNYKALMKMIDGLSEKELKTPFDFSGQPSKKEAHWSRDKNVRDVLIHLYEWHQLMLAFPKNNAKAADKKSAVALDSFAKTPAMFNTKAADIFMLSLTTRPAAKTKTARKKLLWIGFARRLTRAGLRRRNEKQKFSKPMKGACDENQNANVVNGKKKNAALKVKKEKCVLLRKQRWICI